MLGFLSRLPLLSKVLGGALAGSLILSGILGVLLTISRLELSNAKEVIQRLEGWQGEMVQAVRLASGNAKVTPDTAKAQVQSIGTSLVTLANALKSSNDAVDRLTEEKRRAEEAAAREMKARAAAIATAERLSKQLSNRALTPVTPDQMEVEVRRAQDAVYEAGL